MRIDICHASEHFPESEREHYRRLLAGHRAIRIFDDSGIMRGELVWRLETDGVAQITEFGVFETTDRRQGIGSRLLDEALNDMQAYAKSIGGTIATVWLHCEAKNATAHAFYEARGFQRQTVLPSFYAKSGDAVLYCRRLGA